MKENLPEKKYTDARIPESKPGYNAGNPLIDKNKEYEIKEDDDVNLVKKIEELIGELNEDVRKMGMLDETIEKFLEGEEIIMCEYCHTPNVYELAYFPEKALSVYECLKCGKSYEKKYEK